MAEKENKDNGFESLDEDQNIVSEFWSFMKEKQSAAAQESIQKYKKSFKLD